MKKILLTTIRYTVHAPESKYIYGTREIVFDRILPLGLTPIMIPSVMPHTSADELYELCDGVIFSGGHDIDPSIYNSAQHNTIMEIDKERDVLEKHLLERVIEDKKPFLGICRGAQLLALHLGGSLIPHIPDISEEKHGAGQLGKVMIHDNVAQVKKNTKTTHILGKDQIDITCYHHQSVNHPGKDMIVSAATPDGIVEITEHTDQDFFCFGVQSHPEIPVSNDLQPLFEAFAQAVNSR